MTGGFESLSDSSLRAFALFPGKGLFYCSWCVRVYLVCSLALADSRSRAEDGAVGGRRKAYAECLRVSKITRLRVEGDETRTGGAPPPPIAYAIGVV